MHLCQKYHNDILNMFPSFDLITTAASQSEENCGYNIVSRNDHKWAGATLPPSPPPQKKYNIH